MVIRFLISVSTIFLLVSLVQGELKWDKENWALGCDFIGNYLKNAPSKALECGNKCAETDGCTHYMWNKFKKGTCWMKQGCVSKSDATQTNDNKMFCGIIEDRLQNECQTITTKTVTTTSASPIIFLRSTLLFLINAYRTKHCAPPLVLDDELNKSAQERAGEMAKWNRFIPNPLEDVSEDGFSHKSKSVVTYLHGIHSISNMYDSIDSYDFEQPGYSKATEVFTDMVWKSSTKVGVGYAITSDQRAIYVVLHYPPKSKESDDYRKNVLPAQC